MKTFKRVSALFLALLMAFTFVPAFLNETAFASSIGMKEEYTEYTITFSPGNGKGSSLSETYKIEEGCYLPEADDLHFTYDKHTFSGWKIAGKTYPAGATYNFKESDASKSDSQYVIKATAVWTGEGGSSSSSSSSNNITGTYKPGTTPSGKDVSGKDVSKSYPANAAFSLAECPFSADGYTFAGWEIEGKVYAAGVKVQSDEDFVAVATWKAKGIVIGGDDSSSSSSSSTPSTSSSSVAPKPSSSTSSVAPKPSSSTSSVAPKPSSSTSSVVTSSEPEPSSEPETPVIPEEPEIPEEPVFEPVELGYSISGDIPVTKVAYLLNEDIGGTASLWVTALDGYSAVDDATAAFIASGDTLAAFDLSLLSDGATYHGPANGVVTYSLNGTQADASSNYDEYVLALVHVMEKDAFTGSSYYMAEGKKAYLYDTATGAKNEVANLSFAESDGVFRPVLSNIDGLSEFAYLASEDTIAVAKLIPDPSVSEVSMTVDSLSPFLLTQLQLGKASAGGFSIPIWVWIIIAVLVLLIVLLVVLYLVGRNKKNKDYEEEAPARRPKRGGSSVTGFDDL